MLYEVITAVAASVLARLLMRCFVVEFCMLAALGLVAQQSDDEFNGDLDGSIGSIYAASMT